VLYRRLNVGFLHWVLAGLRKMRTPPLSLAPFGSIILYFTMMFILIYTGLGLGDLIFQQIIKMPAAWDIYFRYGLVGILGLGAGLVISLYKQRDGRYLLATGFLIGGIVFLLK